MDRPQIAGYVFDNNVTPSMFVELRHAAEYLGVKIRHSNIAVAMEEIEPRLVGVYFASGVPQEAINAVYERYTKTVYRRRWDNTLGRT